LNKPIRAKVPNTLPARTKGNFLC